MPSAASNDGYCGASDQRVEERGMSSCVLGGRNRRCTGIAEVGRKLPVWFMTTNLGKPPSGI